MKACEILGFDDLKIKVVKVKQWGCEVTIRELGLEDGLALFTQVTDMGKQQIVSAEKIAQAVAWGVIDPDTGERMFSDDDVPALLKKSRTALVFLYGEITNLSTAELTEKN